MAGKSKKRVHRPPKVPTERPGPAGGKRDANRRRKVQRVCDAGLALFCDKGVEATTIDEVVARAEIAKGSFYRYFSGKEELVETIFSPLANELRATLKLTEHALGDATSAHALNTAYLRLAARMSQLFALNLDILRLYLQENRGPEVGARRPIITLSKEIDRSVYALTQLARDHGLLRSDYQLKVGALTLLGAVERLLFAYISGDSMGDPAEVSADLVRVILDGVRA